MKKTKLNKNPIKKALGEISANYSKLSEEFTELYERLSKTRDKADEWRRDYCLAQANYLTVLKVPGPKGLKKYDLSLFFHAFRIEMEYKKRKIGKKNVYDALIDANEYLGYIYPEETLYDMVDGKQEPSEKLSIIKKSYDYHKPKFKKLKRDTESYGDLILKNLLEKTKREFDEL